jgi:hypothetical protein
MSDAEWSPLWPPFEVARNQAGLRRLWLAGSEKVIGREDDAGALELWVDPTRVVAVGTHSRIKRTNYGSPVSISRETSTVLVGTPNPTSFLVLGSPSQVFWLLEIAP